MSDLKRIVNTLRIHRPEYGAIMSSRDAKKAADEIERLTARNKNQCERLDQQIKHNADLINRNAKLQAVVDAARNVSVARPGTMAEALNEMINAIVAQEGDDD